MSEDPDLPATSAPQFAFNDGKAPDALRTIGEVTRALGIRQHVLRYWEEQFPMLRPVKRSGNRRYYRPEDIALIMEINRLVHREGFTLRGARLAIEAGLGKDGPATDGALPMDPPAGESQPQIAVHSASTPLPATLMTELQVIRAELAEALAQA